MPLHKSHLPSGPALAALPSLPKQQGSSLEPVHVPCPSWSRHMAFRKAGRGFGVSSAPPSSSDEISMTSAASGLFGRLAAAGSVFTVRFSSSSELSRTMSAPSANGKATLGQGNASKLVLSAETWACFWSTTLGLVHAACCKLRQPHSRVNLADLPLHRLLLELQPSRSGPSNPKVFS